MLNHPDKTYMVLLQKDFPVEIVDVFIFHRQFVVLHQWKNYDKKIIDLFTVHRQMREEQLQNSIILWLKFVISRL